MTEKDVQRGKRECMTTVYSVNAAGMTFFFIFFYRILNSPLPAPPSFLAAIVFFHNSVVPICHLQALLLKQLIVWMLKWVVGLYRDFFFFNFHSNTHLNCIHMMQQWEFVIYDLRVWKCEELPKVRVHMYKRGTGQGFRLRFGSSRRGTFANVTL